MRPLALLGLLLPACAAPPDVRIGSKKFTESVILGEALVQLARSAGAHAEHRAELGGTRILWTALLECEIDAYVEYTGTIRAEILAGEPTPDEASLSRALEARGVTLCPPLGFSNTYALGMKAETAERLGLRTLSDLRGRPELRFGFSEEFAQRAEGWAAVKAAYGLPHAGVTVLDHDLALRAVATGQVDVVDVYSTEAAIAQYGLRVLEDDRSHFPAYDAVVVMRSDLARRAPDVARALASLAGRLDEAHMTSYNARATVDRVPEARVASDLLADTLGLTTNVHIPTRTERLLAATGQHLVLVGLSLLAAILVAVPLGVLCARRRRLGRVVLGAVGVVQTIPSLALLVATIPLLGLGQPPALVALFLYSLLPIVRSTATGLTDIAPSLSESARALGLPGGARLRLVELPLASRAILSGIKTSAVINVGTATLAAIVGGGGYGQAILTGIRLDRMDLLLEGAVPAALLALLVEGLFDLSERWLVPRGLRLEATR